jgi:hypothetical protein
MDRSSSGVPDGGPSPRALWESFESVHAVTYFAPECRERLAATGLRGFWMGYFASRAAPLGPVGPAAVSAIFFNFHPSMVDKALPDAWDFARPPSVLRARREGAAAALRRISPSVDHIAPPLVGLIDRVVAAADGSGRPLFNANRGLDVGGDPVEALWQGCTSLREHRGDGHVATLVARGLDGCEALVAFAASEGVPADLFRANRGWSVEEWGQARDRLEGRGLFDGDRLSRTGSELREDIERTTDRLAGAPLAALDGDEYRQLSAGLHQVARAVTGGGVIPFPNPIGLPDPGLGGPGSGPTEQTD